MNKKGEVGILLKFVIGLVIAIISIWFLIALVDKFILFGKEKPDSQKVFFEKLNDEIKHLNINQETRQLFELKENYLLMSFNKKDSEIRLKDIEIYSGNKQDQTVVVKKPAECTSNCLCLCITRDDKYLFEDDCMKNICYEYDEEIYNNDMPFFLFGKGLTNLNIKKYADKISITLNNE